MIGGAAFAGSSVFLQGRRLPTVVLHWSSNMNSDRLADLMRWGLNVAARSTGAVTSAYRPCGVDHPLAPENRFLRLHAAFCGIDGKFSRPNAYGNALWRGIFDAAYTQPGDYLVQDDAIWFIAAQPKLAAALCVRTNRTVSFTRPTAQTSTGVNSYGGVTAANVTPIMTGWPASVLAATREVRPLAKLPGDAAASTWTVLLPACPQVILKTADLMSDDLGRGGVVAMTELTDLGWRLAVRQATT